MVGVFGGDRRAQGLSGLALGLPLWLSLGASFGLSPERIEQGVGWLPGCQLRVLLGRPCPGCGLSRAFAALSHGRWGDALAYNISAPFVYTLYWLGALGALGLLTHALVRHPASRSSSP